MTRNALMRCRQQRPRDSNNKQPIDQKIRNQVICAKPTKCVEKSKAAWELLSRFDCSDVRWVVSWKDKSSIADATKYLRRICRLYM